MYQDEAEEDAVDAHNALPGKLYLWASDDGGLRGR